MSEILTSCLTAEALENLATEGNSNKQNNYIIRNHYYFNDEINPQTAKDLVFNLHTLAASIASTCLETGTMPCPIELHLNSNGGSLTDTLQVVQVIEDIQKGVACKIGNALIPIAVNTYMEGNCDSGASVIAAVGSRRHCSKHALSLIHSMKVTDMSTKSVIEQNEALENNKRWEDSYKKVYLTHSKLTLEQIEEMMKHEKYYTPEELLSFGLIDEIV